jgi:hypothetical protein
MSLQAMALKALSPAILIKGLLGWAAASHRNRRLQRGDPAVEAG